jgi:hypothetical protein
MMPNMCAAVQFNLNSSIAPKLQHAPCYQNSHSSILVSTTGFFLGKIFTTWQKVAKEFSGKNAPKSPDL